MRTGVIAKILNKLDQQINPATEEKQDAIIENQTDKTQFTKLTDGTNDVAVTADNQLHVVLMGKVDANNSTSSPLAGDAVFTGTAMSILEYGFVFVTVFSDVASATDGLSVQQSSDGTNWDNTDDFTIPAGTGKTYSFQPAAEFMRVVYTNGSGAQSAFRLQTVLKKTSSLPSSHRISNNLSPEDDASLQIAIIKGQNPAGNYVDFDATTSGNFKVSIEEYDDAANPIRKDMEGGGKVSVGTTAVEATFIGVTKSIIISADTSNTGVLYIGESDVTNLGANAIAFLEAGESLTLDYDDVSNALFVVSDTASQNFFKGALL